MLLVVFAPGFEGIADDGSGIMPGIYGSKEKIISVRLPGCSKREKKRDKDRRVGEKEGLRTVIEERGKGVGVLSERVDVEGIGLTAGLFETVVMVLGRGRGVEVNVASTVVAVDVSMID